MQNIENRLKKTEAYQECMNLMGRYSFYHLYGMHEACGDLFALNTPGVATEMMLGRYEGAEGIRKLYPKADQPSKLHGPEGGLPGVLNIHTMTSPVIEVADDLLTARGTWLSPGVETSPDPKDSAQIERLREDEEALKRRKFNYTPFWAWCKFAADFIQENGKWKIWHLHVYGVFKSPYDVPWTETPPPPFDRIVEGLPAELKPDAPPESRLHSWTATDRPEDIPVVPEAYEAFNPKMRY
jgi:hypothetical protein